MAYRSLIDKQLSLAFKQAKDLAKPAVFNKIVSAEFDFNSSDVVVETESSVPTLVIPIEGTKKPEGTKKMVKQIMVKSKDIGAINQYDTVSFEGKSWTIINPIRDSGFVYVLEVATEA